jgi:protein gp37
MSTITKIQWCHSTVNPVMGCDGCELYPSLALVRKTMTDVVARFTAAESAVSAEIETQTSSGQQHTKVRLREIAQRISSAATTNGRLQSEIASQITEEIEKLYVCYAADLHRGFNAQGNNPGYAHPFEKPRLFAGRVAKAALMPPPTAKEKQEKPWLEGYRRLIFISDMGDSLSRNISFEFLLQEVIASVSSPLGSRHIWPWLSKRPHRMAEFSDWLAKRGIPWPDNLIAMTTVTGPQTVNRVSHLLGVKARYRGLSMEPLWGSVDVPLLGVHWVIVGGQSGSRARPFHLGWARNIRDACQQTGAAFFLKQLGQQPFEQGLPVQLADPHGGDWSEWPSDLRVRELPPSWRENAIAAASEN